MNLCCELSGSETSHPAAFDTDTATQTTQIILKDTPQSPRLHSFCTHRESRCRQVRLQAFPNSAICAADGSKCWATHGCTTSEACGPPGGDEKSICPFLGSTVTWGAHTNAGYRIWLQLSIILVTVTVGPTDVTISYEPEEPRNAATQRRSQGHIVC